LSTDDGDIGLTATVKTTVIIWLYTVSQKRPTFGLL